MSGDGSEPDDRREPLEDLAEEVGQRRDESEPEDDLFAEVTIDELDQGDVWDTIEAEPTADRESEHLTAEVDATVVSKREFCERCRHFAEPPDARCTHDGTEILEFVDRSHVRVSNCPIVEERGLSSESPTD